MHVRLASATWPPLPASTPPAIASQASGIISKGTARPAELAILEQAFGARTVKANLASLIFPALSPESEPSPAFLKRRALLKAKHETRLYVSMMQNAVPPGSLASVGLGSAAPEFTGVGASAFRQSVVGLNMVIGAGCAFFSAYYLSGQYGYSRTTRAVNGLAAMVLILFVEMVLFIIRAHRFDRYDKMRKREFDQRLVPAGIHWNQDKKTA